MLGNKGVNNEKTKWFKEQMQSWWLGGIMEMLSLDNTCPRTRVVKGLLQIWPQDTTNYWVLQTTI